MGSVSSWIRAGVGVEEDVPVSASVVRVDGQLSMILGGTKPNLVQIVPIDEQCIPEYTLVNGHLRPIRAAAPAG